MHKNGKGVTQDYNAAVKWYTLAAEQVYDPAQFNLGSMYYFSQGVIQNFTRAHMWWNIAASQCNKIALDNRDKVAKDMTASQIEKAQKLASECVEKEHQGLLICNTE